MAYTKEQLYDLPVSKLIDIIMTQQNEIEPLKESLKTMTDTYRKIAMLTSNLDEVSRSKMTGDLTEKRGRKPMSPEAKAAAYERQKQMQRERYQAKKQERSQSLSDALKELQEKEK